MDSRARIGWEAASDRPTTRKMTIQRILIDKYHQKMLSICSPVTSLLEGVRCASVIQLKEELELLETKECFTKYYTNKMNQKKLKDLAIYYKYHQEVPRLFMKDKSQIIHEYYDTKRRLIYDQVKRMLASQQLQGRDRSSPPDVKVLSSGKASKLHSRRLLSNQLDTESNKHERKQAGSMAKQGDGQAGNKRVSNPTTKAKRLQTVNPMGAAGDLRQGGDNQAPGAPQNPRRNQELQLLLQGEGKLFKNLKFGPYTVSRAQKDDDRGNRILTESILKEHLKVKEISAEPSYNFDPRESRLLSPEEPQSSSTLMDIKSRLNEAFGMDDYAGESPNILGMIRTVQNTPQKLLVIPNEPFNLNGLLESPHQGISCSLQSNIATRQSSQVYDQPQPKVGIRGLDFLKPGQMVHNLILGNSVNVNLSVNPLSASQTNRRKIAAKNGSLGLPLIQDHQCSTHTCPLCLGPIPATSNGFSKKKVASKQSALGRMTNEIDKLASHAGMSLTSNAATTETGLFRSSQKKPPQRPKGEGSGHWMGPEASGPIPRSVKQKRHRRNNTSGGQPAVVSTLHSANFDDSKGQTVLSRSNNFQNSELRAKNLSMIQKIFSKKQSLNPSKVSKDVSLAVPGTSSQRRDELASRTRALRSLLLPESNDSLQNFTSLAGKSQSHPRGPNAGQTQSGGEATAWKKKGPKPPAFGSKKSQKRPSKVQNLFEQKRMSYEFAMNHFQANPFVSKMSQLNKPVYIGTGVLGYGGLPANDRPPKPTGGQVTPKQPSLYSSQLWENNQAHSTKSKLPNGVDDRLFPLPETQLKQTVTRLFGKKRSDPVPKGTSTQGSVDHKGIFDRKKRSVDHHPRIPLQGSGVSHHPGSLPAGLAGLLPAHRDEILHEDALVLGPQETAGDWIKKMLVKKKKKHAQGARKSTNASVSNYDSLIRSNNFFKFKPVVRGEGNGQVTSGTWRPKTRGLGNRSTSSQKGSKTRGNSPKYHGPDLRGDYQFPEPARGHSSTKVAGVHKQSSRDGELKVHRSSITERPLNIQASLSSNRNVAERDALLTESKPATVSRHSRHESGKIDRRHFEQSDLSSCESGQLDLYTKAEGLKADTSKLLRRQDKKILWTPISQAIPKPSCHSMQLGHLTAGETSSIDGTRILQQRSVVCERVGSTKGNHSRIGTPQIPDFLVPRKALAAKFSGKMDRSQLSPGVGRTSQHWEPTQPKCSPYLLFESSEHPLQRAKSKPQRSGQR